MACDSPQLGEAETETRPGSSSHPVLVQPGCHPHPVRELDARDRDGGSDLGRASGGHMSQPGDHGLVDSLGVTAAPAEQNRAQQPLIDPQLCSRQ